MTAPSFKIIVQNMYGSSSDQIWCTAEVYVIEDTCEIRNKTTGDIIRTTINPLTVWDALCSVQDPDTWDHYMFFSEKPSWVDGYEGYFSASTQDKKELFISMRDQMEKLVSLPVRAIHGGTFCIYPRVRPASSLSEAIRLAILNDPTLLEDDAIKNPRLNPPCCHKSTL